MQTFSRSVISRHPHRQRGVGLLEALAALFVLCMGALSVVGLHNHWRWGSDVSRQRSEAVRLAQTALEGQRTLATQTASAVTHVDVGATTYKISHHVAPGGHLATQQAVVTVDWVDRHDNPQQISLNTFVTPDEPLYSGALSLLPMGGSPLKGAYSRAASVPFSARDLGDGRSVLKLHEQGTSAVLFNNATGDVTARCTGLSAHQATHDLTANDVGSCEDVSARWLSGTVRFSQAEPPHAEQASDPPLPLSMSLQLTGGTYSQPAECTQALVERPRQADRHVAYHCVVPLINGQWSGSLTVVPVGWHVGAGPLDGRVCRYTTDLDGSGAIDANPEHPSVYRAVNESLANQNFLVIKGNQACPAGLAE